MSEFAPRVRWDRIGRLALLFVGLLLIYLYINPLRTYVSTWQEARTKRERGRPAAARARRARQARAGALRSPGSIEVEARRLGMVKADERAYVVRGPRRRGECVGAARGWVACRGDGDELRDSAGPVARGRAADGRRAARAAPRAELVVSRIEAELRRRLGGTFTTDELAELYDRGTDWCTDLAADGRARRAVGVGRAHGRRRGVPALPARRARLRGRAAHGGVGRRSGRRCGARWSWPAAGAGTRGCGPAGSKPRRRVELLRPVLLVGDDEQQLRLEREPGGERGGRARAGPSAGAAMLAAARRTSSTCATPSRWRSLA